MGLLRLLLAISVIFAHTTQTCFVSGQTAVKAFYIISGFYMALILDQKYNGNNSYSLFISNRFLRIFPVYWIVLLLSVSFGVAGLLFKGNPMRLGPLMSSWQQLRFDTVIFIISSNLMIFGQDILMFLNIAQSNGKLSFSGEYLGLTKFLIIPQAWTVSLELLFYIIAPFLVKFGTRNLWIFISICLLGRVLFSLNGLSDDPWSYRFFPFEIPFFLIGIIAYRNYLFIDKKGISFFVGLVMLISIITLTTLNKYVLHSVYKEWIYCASIAIVLPFIFKLTKSIKIDKMIGELSYPVYISHVLLISISNYFLRSNNPFNSLAVIIGSIIFSLILVRFVINPIDVFRQSRAKKFDTSFC